MKAKVAVFRVVFKEPQDVEVDCNNLNDVYLALDQLYINHVIEDYNCQEFIPAEEIDYDNLSLKEIKELIASGKVTADEVARFYNNIHWDEVP